MFIFLIGFHFRSAQNIIFSNGLLDPWAGGGMLRSSSDSVQIIIIPEGAHHIDLREANKDDPESVVIARKQYVKQFRKWIREKEQMSNYV